MAFSNDFLYYKYIRTDGWKNIQLDKCLYCKICLYRPKDQSVKRKQRVLDTLYKWVLSQSSKHSCLAMATTAADDRIAPSCLEPSEQRHSPNARLGDTAFTTIPASLSRSLVLSDLSPTHRLWRTAPSVLQHTCWLLLYSTTIISIALFAWLL